MDRDSGHLDGNMTNFFEWRDAPKADFAVIGDPIHHSLSPVIHMANFVFHQMDKRYVAVRVPSGEVKEALLHLKALGYKGVNVTVPLKEEVFAWEDLENDTKSLEYQSVNTVCLQEMKATNTDAPGFLQSLEEKVGTGASVLVLGAGGTAKSLIPALFHAGYQVCVWNRTQEKVESLLEKYSGILHAKEIFPDQFDLVLNTTSATLTGKSLPIEWTKGSGFAYDIAYGIQSPFLLDAEKNGFQVLDGKEMLVNQAALSFEWWTGKVAHRPTMMGAMIEALHERS